MSLYRSSKPVKYIYCKYCGARLRRDAIGQHCPTKNCKWEHGLKLRDDSPTKKRTSP